jgi:2'-5' RNA ligase
MPYAIELDLDHVGIARVMKLWQQLHTEFGGADLVSMGATPHVSLAVIPEADKSELTSIIQECAGYTAPIASCLSAAAAFPTREGVIFLVPVVTTHLLALHHYLCERLAAASITVNPLYRQEHWIPHCTVALDLPPYHVNQAFALACAADVYHPIQLDVIRLIEFRPIRTHIHLPLSGQAGS